MNAECSVSTPTLLENYRVKLPYEVQSADYSVICPQPKDIDLVKYVITYQSFINEIPKYGQLKEPLQIEVLCEDNFFFISSKELDIIEGGDDLIIAERNFKLYLANFFQSLQENYPNQLTDGAIRAYKSLIKYISV